MDYTDPYLSDVNEVVVTHRSVTNIGAPEDLAGKSVYVRAGSSYVEHLRDLNKRLASTGRPAIEIVESEPDLTTGDILQLVNAGTVSITVVDAYIATAWAQVLPDVVVHPDVVIHAGGRIAWAVRKDSPNLRASLNQFVKTVRRGTLLGNVFFRRYYENTRWIRNPLVEDERRKLAQVRGLMQRFADKYGWDWLAVVALAYQESGLDHSVVSPAGAVGIMQVLPSTAAGPPLNMEDIQTLETNIHAGVKYLAWLRQTYFSDPAIEPAARVDFSWAAYNAGPGRIRQLRRRAEERGYNPNEWFGNVEHIAAEVIGRETVDYVANINMYYAAYRLAFEATEARARRPAKAGDS